MDTTTHVASRAGLAAFTKAMLEKLGPAPPGLFEEYHDIPMRDGYSSTLKIQRPSDTSNPGPLIVLAFGGGFVAGDKDQLSLHGRLLVRFFGATVVLVSYRLAPEYKFPYAQHDALDSLAWAAENATGPLLAADPSKGFIVGGVSAGGGLAAVLSRKAQEHPLAHPLTGQWLCIPTIMDKNSCPEKYKSLYLSQEQNSDAVGLTKKSRDMMTRCAAWDTTSDLRFAVLSPTSIGEQPRTYLQVDGMDPLRDDGLIYEEMLKEAGVPTKIDLYPGCPHGHLFSMQGIEIGNRAIIDIFVGFGWLLQKEIDRQTVAKALGFEAA